MQYDVFISYSRKDSAVADRICEVLGKAGITYFIDRQGVSGGFEFPAVLAEAIVNCHVVLYLASEDAYGSVFAQKELTFAFNKKRKILPYIIDGSSLPLSLEFAFSDIQWLRMETHPIETALVDDLLQLLGKEKKNTMLEDLPNDIIVARALDKDVGACKELARRYYYGLYGLKKNVAASNNYLKKVGLPLYEVVEEEKNVNKTTVGEEQLPKSLKFSYRNQDFYMVQSPDATYYVGNIKAMGEDFSWLNSSWFQVGGSAAIAAGAVALGVLAWPMAIVLFLRAISSWTNEKDKAKAKDFKVDQSLCDELSSTSGYKFAKPTGKELEGVKQEEKPYCVVLRIKDNPRLNIPN